MLPQLCRPLLGSIGSAPCAAVESLALPLQRVLLRCVSGTALAQQAEPALATSAAPQHQQAPAPQQHVPGRWLRELGAIRTDWT